MTLMSDCYVLTIGASQSHQSGTEESFIGGTPNLPTDVEIPRCKLCAAEQTFFFQITFPSKHQWEGMTLALFACTSCAHENHLVPQMLSGPLPGANIPEGFLLSYQTNFRILVFEKALGAPRTTYQNRVIFKPLSLHKTADMAACVEHMSPEQKAYTFAYKPFSTELEPILEAALASGNCQELIDFIQRQRSSLTDPYEGEPLGEDWEQLMEFKDAHQYGDFALTRYYSVAHDIGLGPSWAKIEAELTAAGMKGAELVLGFPVGPRQNLFDPGKMGSYLRSEQLVARHLTELQAAVQNGQVPRAEVLQLESMLSAAASAGRGLYITF